MSPDDRRPFRPTPFDRGDRQPNDRPGFNAPRPFVRTPTRGGDMPPPDHRVRIRDGEREIEVSGNPAFVRQVLDDLPTLLGRLRGEAAGRNGISMPAPPAALLTGSAGQPESVPAAATGPAKQEASDGAAEARRPTARNGARQRPQGRKRGAADLADDSDDLERQVFDVLRTSTRPLAISAIRERIEGQPTGQEVRRLLERAGQRVTRSAERPATYTLR